MGIPNRSGDRPLGPPAKQIRADGLTRDEAHSLREQCYRILGVDLTGVDGINGQFIQVFLSEVGQISVRSAAPQPLPVG
jgi:hypothetical protein